MASKLKMVAGNTAPAWEITCERDGTVIDLANTTVTVNISDGSTVTRTGGVCSIVGDGSTGVIHYTPTASDTPIGGKTYLVDVKITYADNSYEVIFQQLSVTTRKPIISVA